MSHEYVLGIRDAILSDDGVENKDNAAEQLATLTVIDLDAVTRSTHGLVCARGKL